jgi:hypothetical protein
MKEHPILFKTDMVKAILENRKPQTRRVVKQQADKREFFDFGGLYVPIERMPKYCPYGQVGDRLWVKETFMFNKGADVRESFVGTTSEFVLGEPPHYLYKASSDKPRGFKWRPSIFMPRKASRITLEITDIRVQRLNEIGYDDAIAEGMSKEMGLRFGFASPYPEDKYLLMLARHIYVALWDSINGKKCPFSDNPFVWVISFKRV